MWVCGRLASSIRKPTTAHRSIFLQQYGFEGAFGAVAGWTEVCVTAWSKRIIILLR
jgi:hypothetical protein